MKLKMILIDAGHGGILNGIYQTLGKRSPIWDDGSQYYEGVGNRMIRHELSKYLDLLRGAGIRYEYVNKGQRDMPLYLRVRYINSIARKYRYDEVLLISIHSNGYKDKKAHGWSCYTTPGDTMSDKYAEVLYEKMEEQFPEERMRTDYSDGDKDKEAYFKLLKSTICPAILSENFFHTNEHECRDILMCRQGRSKIALAHFNMIKEFI